MKKKRIAKKRTTFADYGCASPVTKVVPPGKGKGAKPEGGNKGNQRKRWLEYD